MKSDVSKRVLVLEEQNGLAYASLLDEIRSAAVSYEKDMQVRSESVVAALSSRGTSVIDELNDDLAKARLVASELTGRVWQIESAVAERLRAFDESAKSEVAEARVASTGLGEFATSFRQWWSTIEVELTAGLGGMRAAADGTRAAVARGGESRAAPLGPEGARRRHPRVNQPEGGP